DDRGETWSSAVRVNDDTGSALQLDPDFAVDPGNGVVHLAWTDYRNGEDSDIYSSRSEDDGETWSENLQVNDSSSGGKSYPAIACGADENVHVAWTDTRSPTNNVLYKIYYSKSTNAGDSWGTNVRIDDDTSGSNSEAEVAVDENDRVIIAWRRSLIPSFNLEI